MGASQPVCKVLNVNDRDATRYLITQMLKASGFEIIEATTGRDALAACQGGVDAVVLDVRLPDFDGYQVCRRLKTQASTAGIPVLLTSAAFVGSEHRVEGLEAGADAYLVQPFETDELSATLRALLRIRAAERKAQKLAVECMEAVRLRDEFLSIAAHELKTPLTSLHLQLDSLANGITRPRGPDGDRKLLGKVETAIRQTNRLTVLIDDLIDVSRLTQGRLSLCREKVNLAELVQEVAGRFSSEAERARCPIKLSIGEILPCYVDRLHVEQIFVNLISNAIKYGAKGTIEVELNDVPDHVRIVVRDQGIGIAQTDQERIFDRFERAVSSRHYGGMGLGLFITRRIVELHGGTIQVASRLREGSAFTVMLPRGTEASVEASMQAGAPPQTEGMGPCPH